MVAVYGARGDDVVLVLIHQGQLGVVVDCRKKRGGYKSINTKAQKSKEKFSSYHDDAAIKAAVGRAYRIKMRMRPVVSLRRSQKDKVKK